MYKTLKFWVLLSCLSGIVFMPDVLKAQAEDEEEVDPGPQIFGLHIQKLDTRSLSLGDATVADVYGRGGIGVNPALFGLYENKAIFRLSANHNWGSSQLQSYFSLPVMQIGGHNFTARAGYINYGFDFDRSSITGEAVLPESDIEIYHADVAYAYAIDDLFSVGLIQSISIADNSRQQYLTYSADIGIVYVPDGPVTYGMVFRGLGYETIYHINDSGNTVLEIDMMRQSLELGATLHYPIESRNLISISFANEKRFGEEGIWYKAGFELLPTTALSLRSGFIFHLVDETVFIPRFGLGLNAQALSLDYAISPKNVAGEYFHQLGFTIQF